MGDSNRDPSMEEILASIKRVISEEAPAAPALSTIGRAAAEEEDVLELSHPHPAERGAAPASGGENLISHDAAAASRTKLAALAEMRRNGEIVPPTGDGPLEAVVRQMLRPMLKEWLDAHLPEIVNELVTREIARITSGQDI